MNKNLQKAIINRSRLLNKYKKEKTEDERITLVENNKVVSDESKLVEIFSKYFGNIVQNLGIDGLTNISSDNNVVTI